MTSKRIRSLIGKQVTRYTLGSKYPGVYLNRREAQCIKYLLGKKSIKEIGAILTLSPRTVDDYLKKLRKKLGCSTRSELLALIKNSDFKNHYAAIESLQADVDLRNYKAILLLEFFGNENPNEQQIMLAEKLLDGNSEFKYK